MENTNLTRKQQKIFAGNTTVSEEQIAVFGSKTQTGTMAFSKDPDVIQNENWQNGWQNATVLEQAPFEEDFNAISFVNSYNTAYLLQKGIPEYSASTTYFKGSICSIINSSSEPSLYYSLTDNNIGNNPTTDSINWAKYSDIFSDDYTKIDGSNATFANLSQTAKENIINSYILDYNNPISLTSSGMVSTANGFLLCMSLTTKEVTVSINGKQCFRFATSDSISSVNYGIYGMVPIFKGDVITWNSGFNSEQSMILPFISNNN